MKSNEEIKKKIEGLIAQIQEHDYRYYVLADPSISDFEYDQLINQLVELETAYPEFITPYSPSQRIGDQPTKEFPTYIHNTPMLSLANTYSEEELFEFNKRIKNVLGNDNFQYVAELKLDGAAVTLTYRNNLFTIGGTRGDGMQGDEITNNLKAIRSIPLRIKDPDKKYLDIEVRGEVFMTHKDFLKINEEREMNDEKLFSNPRNSAAGTLKLQDPKLVSERNLSIFIYYLSSNSKQLTSHYENLQILKDLGFPVNPHSMYCKDIQEVIRFCKEWEDKRDSLPYDIDGVVVKVDSIKQQTILGAISKSPRCAIAYKFVAKQALTKLNGITLQVGRIGTITPVAELEPVSLAGSIIKRATLHNENFIIDNDIRINDFVYIEKGGDVIPKVVSVDLSKRTGFEVNFKMPSKCPVCNSTLNRQSEEVAYYCENSECPSQIKGRIFHFSSRSALDISGLGESVIEQLVEKKFLHNIADIFDLKKHSKELENLERQGKKSIQNLLDSIEICKSKPFSKVLFGLGIRYVGTGTATLLAKNFKSLENLMVASKEELENIYEIGPNISNSVMMYFAKPNNQKIIDRLIKAGLNFKIEHCTNPIKEILSGKSFVLTGELESYTREMAKSLIEERGGKVTGTVSKKTSFVISGKNPGSKLDRAKSINISVLDEEEFKNLLKL